MWRLHPAQHGPAGSLLSMVGKVSPLGSSNLYYQILPLPSLMTNPEWQTIAAMGGLPVLFLPETRGEVVRLLEHYLREGEVVVQGRQLKELQEALSLLRVSLGLQVQRPVPFPGKPCI